MFYMDLYSLWSTHVFRVGVAPISRRQLNSFRRAPNARNSPERAGPLFILLNITIGLSTDDLQITGVLRALDKFLKTKTLPKSEKELLIG